MDVQELSLQRVVGVSQPVAASAAIAFHPLTTTLAYAAGSAVVLRDIVSDNSVRVFSKAATDQCTPAIRCLTFCPNARWLAAGEDGRNAEVLLYDLHKGAPTHPALTLRRHKYSVTSVCFSHDGAWLVSSGDPYEGAVLLWDVTTGHLLTRQTCAAEQHSAMFAAPAAFCTAGRGQCTLWTVRGGSTAAAMRVLQKPVVTARDEAFTALAACPGQPAWLAMAATGKVMSLWLRGGQVEHRIVDAQVAGARCLAVSSETVAVGGAQGVVRLLTHALAPKGCLPKPLVKSLQKDGTADVGCDYPDAVGCTFSADGTLLCVVYSDRSLHVWDVQDPQKVVRVTSLINHAAAITGVAVVPVTQHTAGIAATASVDGSLRFWNIMAPAAPAAAHNALVSLVTPTAEPAPRARAPAARVGLLASSPALQRAVAAGQRVAFSCVAVSHDGLHVAAGDALGVLRVYDMATMALCFSKGLHQGDVSCLSYAAQADATGCLVMASGGVDGRVHLLGLVGSVYTVLQTLVVGTQPVTAMQLRGDGERLMVCSHSGGITFWKHTGPPSYFVEHNRHAPSKQPHIACAIHDDAAVTATAAGQLFLWDMEHGILKKTRVDFESLCTRHALKGIAAMTGNASVLALADDVGKLMVVDAVSGVIGRGHAPHAGRVAALALALDGQSLVSVASDGCMLVWGLPGGPPAEAQSKHKLPKATEALRDTAPCFETDAVPGQASGQASARSRGGWLSSRATLQRGASGAEDKGDQADVLTALKARLPDWAKPRVGAHQPARGLLTSARIDDDGSERPAAEPHAPPEVVEDVAMVDDVLLDGENTMAAANAPSHGSHPPLSACLTTPDTAGAVISPEPSADQGSEKVLQPRDLFREGALGAQRSTSDDHWVGVLPNSMAFDDARVSTPGSSARPSRRPSLGCLPEMQACLDALGGEWTSLQTKLAASPRHSRSSSLERQRSCAARMQGLLGGQSTLDELLDNLPSCGSRVGFQEGSAHHRPDSSGQPLVSSSTFVAFDCNPEALKDDTPPLVRVTAAVRGVDPAQAVVRSMVDGPPGALSAHTLALRRELVELGKASQRYKSRATQGPTVACVPGALKTLWDSAPPKTPTALGRLPPTLVDKARTTLRGGQRQDTSPTLASHPVATYDAAPSDGYQRAVTMLEFAIKQAQGLCGPSDSAAADVQALLQRQLEEAQRVLHELSSVGAQGR